ncbi:class I SAM-dependent methyltransferase [Streptomyces sp. TR06-5]|uniref:class I SAM-dependent methyltransferase n=1 Tax=Streptomyces sp. TR06-5 TaxID=3385976 RepID=UPI0039A372C7
MSDASEEWSTVHDRGRRFRPLGPVEKRVLADLTAARRGRALDVGCGTGELAVFLAGLGHTVDAADFAPGALRAARREHRDAVGVRWIRRDIERDGTEGLAAGGYHLITLRLVVAFLRDRERVLRDLGRLLRPGGALVVVTPVAEYLPSERRHIALDTDEIARLSQGWGESEQWDDRGTAIVVLRRGEG